MYSLSNLAVALSSNIIHWISPYSALIFLICFICYCRIRFCFVCKYFDCPNQPSSVVSFSKSKMNKHNVLTAEAQTFDLDGVGLSLSCPTPICGTSGKVLQTSLRLFHSHRIGMITTTLPGGSRDCNVKAFLIWKKPQALNSFYF